MTLTFHVLWMVCALGTIVFASASAMSGRRIGAFLSGFVATAWGVSTQSLPSAEWIGALALASVVISIGWRRYGWLGAAGGGAVAGVWVTVLQMQGLGRAASGALAFATVAGALWVTRRRPHFAPERLREEAMLVIAIVGSALTILPGVLEGWQAAAALNVNLEPPQATATPLWVLGIVAMSLSGGVAYSIWSRR